MIVTGKATVGSPAKFNHGSPLEYNRGRPLSTALLLVIISAFIMFQNSVSSDLLKSLVDYLNSITPNDIVWYYVTAAPSACQPGEAVGIVELTAPTIENISDGTITYKYRVALNVEYRYISEAAITSQPYESVKALSWLYSVVNTLIKRGYQATFTNGEVHHGLFARAKIVSTRFVEPRLQDSLIGSACSIAFEWQATWQPQPIYLI